MHRVSIRRRAIKDLSKIPAKYVEQISRNIDQLAVESRPTNSKKLKANSGYSLWIGTYRVLYDIDDNAQHITIYRIRHRRESYR
ncbi:MAG: type II toxin-antitoxin system RelE family toxin [Elainellaceae cyanobacterium]